MKTLHLTTNFFPRSSIANRWLVYLSVLITIFLVMLSPGVTHAMITLFIAVALFYAAKVIIKRAEVSFTLTPYHLAQQVFNGGWSVKWNNVHSIGLCHFEDKEGWRHPLPWVGIRLKHYEPYLEAVCPRFATTMLLNQRGLLYIGLEQKKANASFEDVVLDSKPYMSPHGRLYKGLLAIMANRMQYQREMHGYDIFIAAGDLDRSPEAFIGLARRYLAAAEPEQAGEPPSDTESSSDGVLK